MPHVARSLLRIVQVFSISLALVLYNVSATAVPVLYGIDTGFGSGGGSAGSDGAGGGTGGGNISFLVRLDQVDGAVTLVGEPGFGGSLSALAANPTDGTLFSVRGGRAPNNPTRLITINPHTGNAISIGETGIEFGPPQGEFNQFGSARQNVSDLTFNAAGTSLLGIVSRGTQLGKFDTSTGAATKLGDTVCPGNQCSRGNALAFDNGDLFLVHSERFFDDTEQTFIQQIDPANGNPIGANVAVNYDALDLAPFDGPNVDTSYRIGGMAVHPTSGEVFVAVLDGQAQDGSPSNSILGKLNLITGAVSGIANTGLKLEGLAFIDDSFLAVDPSDDISALVINADHSRVNRSANLSGFGTGDFLAFQIDLVTPNPLDGIGGENTSVLGSQNGVNRQLFFFDDPALSGEYFRQVPYSDGTGGGNAIDLTGSWELTINNPGSSNSPIVINTPEVGDAEALPFVTNISITPDGLTPTFNWVLPNGGTNIDQVSVFITDLNQLTGPGSAATIHIEDLTGTATSFIAPAILDSGAGLEFGGKYEVVVNVRELRPDGTTLSRTTTHAAFSPIDADTGGVEVFIPTVDPSTGEFNFDLAIAAGFFPVILDPFVAVGYDFEIGAGDDPFFDSVMVLTDAFAPGTGSYELLFPDPGSGLNAFFSAMLAPGQLFSFTDFQTNMNLTPDGVPSFTIQGIPPEAGLDPQDALAFLTQVEFVGPGQFTGSMTPIQQFVATPEPGTLVLMGLGLAGLGFRLRNKRH